MDRSRRVLVGRPYLPASLPGDQRLSEGALAVREVDEVGAGEVVKTERLAGGGVVRVHHAHSGADIRLVGTRLRTGCRTAVLSPAAPVDDGHLDGGGAAVGVTP